MREELYTGKDVKRVDNMEGEIVVVSHTDFTKEYQKPEFQLWLCDGGFGAQAGSLGTAVFATCLEDGEHARFHSGRVLGVLKDELVTDEIKDKAKKLKETSS